MASEKSPPKPRDAALDAATDRLMPLHEGEPGASAELERWLDADAENREAWQDLDRVWQRLEGLRAHADLPGAQPLAGEKRSAIARNAGRSRAYATGAWPVLATAASVLLLVGLYCLYPPLYWQSDYRTQTGEQLRVSLADGSRLTLNTATAIAVDFDGATRSIRLLAGEAYFEVAKDAQRPFIVHAEQGSIRAVGTAFSVLQEGNGTQVELLEGIVDLKPAAGAQTLRLAAGQVAQMGRDSISVQGARASDSLASWRDGYLQFDRVPLRSAIAHINRYRPGYILLLNEQLARHRVSGSFPLDDLEKALDTVTDAVPGLRRTALGSRLVVLR